MCGIIGYIGRRDAVPVIIDGLKKLEYRGYDSAGIAVYNEDGFLVRKQKGRIAGLEAALAEEPIQGHVGIGHTRWATHGEPSDVNSHPHISDKGKIAVVHNGIIENYKELKEHLEQRGITFRSQTDSEVIAQLAEYYYDGDMAETVVKLANALDGSYALGIMCLDEPGKIYAVKKDNPLIIGVSEDGNFIASDVPALLRYTNQVIYLNDKEIAVLEEDKVSFRDMDLAPLAKAAETITWSLDSAEKGGYPHFMLKEIMEQPKIIRETIDSLLKQGDNKEVMEGLDPAQYNKLVITACGSAYNAGFCAKYVFEKLCRVNVEVELASEFRYKDPIVDSRTLVILVSQSGETADTIAAMREAKTRGAQTLAIVNVIGSTIAKEADHTIYTLAGPEIAVATTKAFSAQLVALDILAVTFAKKLGKLSPAEVEAYFAVIKNIPAKVRTLLGSIDDIQRYASTCIGYKSIFFIGRNIDYAIALEGSLKLKEISYIHSEAYAAGELKHGTISLIEENTLVVALANVSALYPKIVSNVEQVISRGAKVLFIGKQTDSPADEKVFQIPVPDTHELFSPSLSAIVLQLFAYYVAANKGLDIDKPRNLAKSVTVE